MLTTITNDATARLQAIIAQRTAAVDAAVAQVMQSFAPSVGGAQADVSKAAAALQDVRQRLCVKIKEIEQVWLWSGFLHAFTRFQIPFRAVLSVRRRPISSCFLHSWMSRLMLSQ